MRIALLGTGRMGSVLGGHLLEAGYDLTVWNRTASLTAPLVAAGAHLAASAAQAVAGADVIITCLFGPASVEETVIAPSLIPASKIWLDITTVGPDDAAAYANWAARHGVRYVAAPVVGSLGPAKARKLGSYLGGSPADVAAVEPIVDLWTSAGWRVPVADQRASAVGKLLANLALAIALEGLAEALAFGRTQLLTPSQAIQMLGGTFLAGIADAKGPVILADDYTDTQFSVDLLAKDIGLMLDASGSGGTGIPGADSPCVNTPSADSPATASRFPALTAALWRLRAVQQRGAGNQDVASMVTAG